MEHKVQGSTKHAKTRQAKVVQETGHMCTYVCGARELVTKRQALSLQIHCQDIKTSRNNSIIIIRAHMRTLEPFIPVPLCHLTYWEHRSTLMYWTHGVHSSYHSIIWCIEHTGCIHTTSLSDVLNTLVCMCVFGCMSETWVLSWKSNRATQIEGCGSRKLGGGGKRGEGGKCTSQDIQCACSVLLLAVFHLTNSPLSGWLHLPGASGPPCGGAEDSAEQVVCIWGGQR